MATSCTDFNHPFYEKLNDKNPKETVEFFTENNAKRMKLVSLGEALDFISWGGMNYVVYPLDTKKMTNFIRKWMGAQKSLKIEYKEIKLSEHSYTYKEKSRKNGYLWNRFPDDFPIKNEKLPRINYSECPRNERGHNHKKTIEDKAGRTRCAETFGVTKIKPSFSSIVKDVCFLSATERNYFHDDEPHDPTPAKWTDEEGNEIDWSPEYNEYLEEKEKYDDERGIQIINSCYAIIKEPQNKYLPLQTILDRLNCSHSFYSDKNSPEYFVTPFSGFTIANYVQAWFEQPGKKKVWKKKHELDFHKHFKNFTPISSED